MSSSPRPVSTLSGDDLASLADSALSREQLSAAIALYDQAEKDVLDPDRCAGGRWMAHMLGGNFEAAWLESDAIRRRGSPDPHRFWNGEDLRGKRLMLRSLHGFGDAVQMFRFLPRLQEQVAHLIVEVPPRLLELAPCFSGMGQVITWGEQAPRVSPPWDIQMEVMELPFALRVTTDQLAPRSDYLHLPQELLQRAATNTEVRNQPRVGLVWQAGDWNRMRSIPFATLRGLLDVSGITFWSLQGDAGRADWQTLEATPRTRDVYEMGDGILPLAAVVAQMDLVITVDTLVAHLAGALGVPCWVLLQHRADWRWMCGRDDTPWYSSLRLWRQTAEGGWEELLQRIHQQLVRWRDTPKPNRAG